MAVPRLAVVLIAGVLLIPAALVLSRAAAPASVAVQRPAERAGLLPRDRRAYGRHPLAGRDLRVPDPNLHQEGLLVLVSVVRGGDGSPNDLVFRGAAERAAVSA